MALYYMVFKTGASNAGVTDNIFVFTLNNIADVCLFVWIILPFQNMWHSGAWPLSFLIVTFSGIWPYARIVLLFAMWFMPCKILTAKRREICIMVLGMRPCLYL